MNNIEFKWNGIKVNGGKLIPCWIHVEDNGVVHISARDYGRGNLPEELNPTNDTDTMTDYFDTDRASLRLGSPYYTEAVAAAKAATEHFRKVQEKRIARSAAWQALTWAEKCEIKDARRKKLAEAKQRRREERKAERAQVLADACQGIAVAL